MAFVKQALVMLLLVTFVCPVASGQQSDGENVLQKQEKIRRSQQEEYRELYDRLPKLEITGMVVDQFGDPVPDANVTIVWENADELLGKMPKRRAEGVKTDAQGCFRLWCNKPVEAKAEAEKAGYAPLSGTARNLVHVHDQTIESVPAVITLRKRGEPTFLLRKLRTGGHWVRMSTNSAEKVASDLLVSVAGDQRLLDKREDLCASISYDEGRKCWVVDYLVAPGDGIICFDTCVYEAPVSGYTNRVSLTISNDAGDVVNYLCLRNRSPTIYSRVEVKHAVSRDQNCAPIFRIFREEICVNPYGERNLEYDERFERSWRARDELTQEALMAIGQGRYPEKCGDVPARIKAADKRKKWSSN